MRKLTDNYTFYYSGVGWWKSKVAPNRSRMSGAYYADEYRTYPNGPVSIMSFGRTLRVV